MGHTDEEMTPRYTHVIEEDAREVAASFDQFLLPRWCEPLTAEKMSHVFGFSLKSLLKSNFSNGPARITSGTQSLYDCETRKKPRTVLKEFASCTGRLRLVGGWL